MNLQESKYFELEEKAKIIRINILKMLNRARSGHTAGSLGMVEVFTSLYFNLLRHNPKDPCWNERDRLILSNGHICPVLYATLAEAGYFPKHELFTLRKLHSRLQGHPQKSQKNNNHNLPGIENPSGPLGQGISQSVGFAIAAKLKNQNHKIFCITSDGEQNEGQTWEAYLLASKYKLDNLIFLLDRNHIQIDGETKDVLPLESLRSKFESFGMHVMEINAHDFNEIINVVNHAKSLHSKPIMIICNSIPGRGVSFMEYHHEWHGKFPNNQELIMALEELNGT